MAPRREPGRRRHGRRRVLGGRDSAGPVSAVTSPPLLTYRGAVYPSQCDHMGHMNVSHYVAKFDEATWQLFAAIGLTRARLQAESRGMAGLEQNIEYKRELFAGDVVTVTSAILEVKEKVLRFVHEMRDDATGEVAAR